MPEKSVYCSRRDDRDMTSTLQCGPRRMLLLSVLDWMRPHDLLSPSSWQKEQTGFYCFKKRKDLKVNYYGTFLQTSYFQSRPQQPLSQGTAKRLTLSSDVIQGNFVFISIFHMVSLKCEPLNAFLFLCAFLICLSLCPTALVFSLHLCLYHSLLAHGAPASTGDQSSINLSQLCPL